LASRGLLPKDASSQANTRGVATYGHDRDQQQHLPGASTHRQQEYAPSPGPSSASFFEVN
jgi:hypothetical protein